MADDKVNILLVDDQPAKLLTYRAILGDIGENLLSANNATEASNSSSRMMSRWFLSTSICRTLTAFSSRQ